MCRIVYHGAAYTNADGSDPADVCKWRLKRAADAAAASGGQRASRSSPDSGHAGVNGHGLSMNGRLGAASGGEEAEDDEDEQLEAALAHALEEAEAGALDSSGESLSSSEANAGLEDGLDAGASSLHDPSAGTDVKRGTQSAGSGEFGAGAAGVDGVRAREPDNFCQVLPWHDAMAAVC
jgi:hypothetical protein